MLAFLRFLILRLGERNYAVRGMLAIFAFSSIVSVHLAGFTRPLPKELRATFFQDFAISASIDFVLSLATASLLTATVMLLFEPAIAVFASRKKRPFFRRLSAFLRRRYRNFRSTIFCVTTTLIFVSNYVGSVRTVWNSPMVMQIGLVLSLSTLFVLTASNRSRARSFRKTLPHYSILPVARDELDEIAIRFIAVTIFVLSSSYAVGLGKFDVLLADSTLVVETAAGENYPAIIFNSFGSLAFVEQTGAYCHDEVVFVVIPSNKISLVTFDESVTRPILCK